MKTLLVTGNGQLARSLMALAPRFAELGYTPRQAARPEFDFDRPATIDAVFAATSPSIVVNAAAWTAVDLAETERDAVARANDTGPTRLGKLCAAADIPFLHISTDYVFDGDKGAPYVEGDQTNPTGVYGATKLAGEKGILGLGGKVVILRTSWVYAAEGKNFVRTMLAAAQRMNNLRVVADQRGCPTSAMDLAQAIAEIVARIDQGWRPSDGGIFHTAGTGDTNWYDFALAIFAAAAPFGRPLPYVDPIATADWPTPARRPADSRLDCHKLAAIYDVRLPEWRPSLERVVADICHA